MIIFKILRSKNILILFANSKTQKIHFLSNIINNIIEALNLLIIIIILYTKSYSQIRSYNTFVILNINYFWQVKKFNPQPKNKYIKK